MNWLALVEHPDHVCCRYRLRAFEPALRRNGHVLTYHGTSRSPWRSLLHPPPPADIAILQRRLPPAWELRLLRRRYPALIFDFDDAVWLRDSYSAKGLYSARRIKRFSRVIEAAAIVTAGNDFLADYASQFIDRERIRVIPTCIDPMRYPLADHENEHGVRLVWLGSSSTLRGLERISPILERLGSEIPGVSLKVICDRFPKLQRLAVNPVPWAELTECRELASSHIGIAWVPDDDWSRGKCGLKVLQYMAAGLPVIANRVGVHTEMVRPGENGLLADGESEWIDAVRTLANSPSLRKQMGRAGRQRVERDFSITRGASDWLKLSRSWTPTSSRSSELSCN